MKKSFIVFVLCTSSIVLFGQENPLSDLIKQKKIGTLTAKAQFIVIARKGNSNQTAASQAITFEYKSWKLNHFTFGFQFIQSRKLMGSDLDAEKLNTSNFNTFNHLYLKYDLDKLGLKKSNLTIGRQRLNTHFSLLYEIRQKEQAFEGIVLRVNEFDKMKIQLGHFNKFSNWKSHNSGFKNMEEINNISSSTKSFQFIDVKYKGVKNTEIGFYNLYGKYSYNITGFHIDHTLKYENKLRATFSLRYILQKAFSDPLRPNSEVFESSKAFQIGIKLKRGNFSIHPGIFLMNGGEMKTPFQPALIIEEPMYESDFGFMGGSDSFFTEASYKYKNESFYFLYLNTKSRSDVNNYNKEWNLIYSHSFKKGLYVKFKTALINPGLGKTLVNDYRIFIGFNF